MMFEEEKNNQRDLIKYKELIKNPKILSRLYEPSEENIKLCAEYIQKGGIVGMPTETVYGLAANALMLKLAIKFLNTKDDL